MFTFDVNPDSFVPVMIFAVPIVAIVGGITAGIVRTIGQQRLIEMAQRERIAAIERGIDPSKLAPLPVDMSDLGGNAWDRHAYGPRDAHRRSQGLMIGGLVTLFVGISLGIFLGLVSGERYVWTVGLMPASVGLALIIGSFITRPRENGGPGAPPSAH